MSPPARATCPGVLIRSIFPTPTGTQAGRTPSYFTGNQSPLSERFGGWYVTGTHGAQTHMGNAVSQDREHPEVLDRAAGANVTDLSSRFDTSPYLTPHSDIVAQLVQAHQTQMHNLITLTNYQTRIALYEEAGRTEQPGCRTRRCRTRRASRFEAPAEELVRYLMFADEAPLEGRGQRHVGFRRGVRGARPARSARALAARLRPATRACSSIRSAT